MRLRPGVRRRELADGESVALSPDGAQALVLNPMASVVLELCDGRAPGEIAAVIAERFADVAREAILADVSRILEQLVQAQIVEEI